MDTKSHKSVIFYSVLIGIALIATVMPWMSVGVSGSASQSLGSGFTLPKTIKGLINGTATLSRILNVSLSDLVDAIGAPNLSAMFAVSLLIYIEPAVFGLAYYFLLAKKDTDRFVRMTLFGLAVIVVMPIIYILFCSNLNSKIKQAISTGLSIFGLSGSSSVSFFHVGAGLVLALLVGLFGLLYTLIVRQMVKSGQKVSPLSMEISGLNGANSNQKEVYPKQMPTQTEDKPPRPSAAFPKAIVVELYEIGDELRRLALTHFPAVIGSDDKLSSAVIEAPSVGAKHCMINVEGDQAMICDLGSANGTYIENERLSPREYYAMMDGDHLKIGEVSLLVKISQRVVAKKVQKIAPLPSESQVNETEETTVLSNMPEMSEEKVGSETIPINYNGGESPFPRKIMTWLDGRDTFMITKTPFILGREAEKVDFVIDDRGISHQHLAIVRENEEFFAEDLNSKNGIKINGVQAAPGAKVKIHSGDVITIGVRNYRFEDE